MRMAIDETVVGATIDAAGTTMRVKGRPLDTSDGVVFLTGSVRSEQEKEKAAELTRETKGVKDEHRYEPKGARP